MARAYCPGLCRHLCDYANAASSFKSALAIAPGDSKTAQYLARAKELDSQSYYSVLQVAVGASEKEIKKAYRKMCLTWVSVAIDCWLLWSTNLPSIFQQLPRLTAFLFCSRLKHPDKHSQSKDAQHRASCVFKSIQKAYEELSDPLKRIMYVRCSIVTTGTSDDSFCLLSRLHSDGRCLLVVITPAQVRHGVAPPRYLQR